MNDERVRFAQLAAITGCLVLALVPNIGTLPPWVLIAACASAALRLALAARGRGAPPRALRLTAAAITAAILLLEFHTFNGITAGTALLALMAGLKLLETTSRRDLYVLVLIIYFLALAALLRGTSFWLLSYLVLVCWLTTAVLLRLTRTLPAPQWPASLKHSARVFLQALPLALLLWLLFPRLATPLWHVSEEGGGGASGLSDTMSPGAISDLALSDEIAFRVTFAAGVPAPQELYWRGPVLHDFDGTTWSRGASSYLAAPQLSSPQPAYRYSVNLEPYRHSWIYTLDRPVEWNLRNATLTADYVLVRPEPVARELTIEASSLVRATSSEPLAATLRSHDLRLPAGRNPRTLELARELRRANPDDRGYVHAILAMLHEQAFYYTLSPPLLGAEPVDEFLFDTRQGFCEHYASAFAVLMRAAAIPAHVVTGYQGAVANPYADYWIVRQSDAHAWDEVWIEGEGWVRIDPTAAVAAARVAPSARDAGRGMELLGMRLPGRLPWLANLGLRIDALRQLWRSRVLDYDQSAQHELLAQLSIPDPDGAKLAILLATVLCLAFLWLSWQVRRELTPAARDVLSRAYGRFCAKLAKIGLPRLRHEGAEGYAARVAAARPDLAAALTTLARQYSDLRYGAHNPQPGIAAYVAAVRAFRPAGRQSLKRRDSRAS